MNDKEIVVKTEPKWNFNESDDLLLHNQTNSPIPLLDNIKNEPDIDEKHDDEWREIEALFDSTINEQSVAEEQPKKKKKIVVKKEQDAKPKSKSKPVTGSSKNNVSSASHLGTLELRRMASSIHKKKKVVVKNFRIDATKEKTKQTFLHHLKTVLANENTKIKGLHETLLPFQESVFSENIQQQIDQNIACSVANKELKRVIIQQQELDKRQRVLAKQFELIQEYIEKQSKQSEQSLNVSLQAQRKLTTVINDILGVVNHTMMEKQAQENMYISAQNTRQDIYQSSTHSPLAANPPLFRNYRTVSENDLKATVKLRSKKKEYILKSEK